MEFCSDNLNNIIEEKPKCFDRQSSETMNSKGFYISCQLFKELLESVGYLHESNSPIIHRDLKPANILITEESRNGRFLKLCDLGLAREIGSETLYLTKAGTRDYMPLEVRTVTGCRAKFSSNAIYLTLVLSQRNCLILILISK